MLSIRLTMASSPSQYPISLPRRFAVEPFETTIRFNRLPNAIETLTINSQSPRRFLPQLQETSTKSSRRTLAAKAVNSTADVALPQAPLPDSSSQGGRLSVGKPRRFSPQLIETTRRSKRRGNTTSAISHTDETDFSGDRVHLPRHGRVTQRRSRPFTQEDNLRCIIGSAGPSSESRFSSLSMNRNVRRQTSFQVPHLPPILSSPNSEGSNDSKCPSLSTSPSAISDETDSYRRASRERESCDDRFSGYLLELAARAAEKQLREQAMAAYPNEKLHEPVHHFAVDPDSDSSDDEMGTQLLSSDTVVENTPPKCESAAVWICKEVRLSNRMPERQWSVSGVSEPVYAKGKTSMNQTIEIGITMSCEPKVVIEGSAFSEDVKEIKLTPGLVCMRSAASPPMLGKDLQFTLCISPKQTRFDTTQYPSRKLQGGFRSRQNSGLWTPSGANSRQSSCGGLWNGVCTYSDKNVLAIPQVPRNGLLTPPANQDYTCAATHVDTKRQLPASPDSDECDITGIDGMLSLEQSVEAEFDDGFVTQIYNYLSLGYPALAWKFDSELSKISKVPLEDIRRDDQRVNAKGYIGAPEGNGCDHEEVKDRRCARWEALRLYIREWARQQTGMVDRGNRMNDSWGVRARRGSWAI